MTKDSHYKDELQDLLSGRLHSTEKAAVENHLQACPECRREYESLSWTKQVIVNKLPTPEIPSDLQMRIGKVLDQADREPALKKPLQQWKALLPYAAVLVLVLAGVLYFLMRSPDLPSQIAKDFQEFQAGRLSLDLRTDDERRMEQFFADRGIPFRTRVFDLAMMKYELVGGRVHELIHRDSALFVYRGEKNEILLCQMYPGRSSDLPEGALIRENKGIRFHVYKRENLTMVFWPEGNVFCVLVSGIDAERLVQLAFAKAEASL